MRKATRGTTNKKDDQTEQRRKEHQKQLLKQKQEELEERLKTNSFGQAKKKTKTLELSKLKAYANQGELPKEAKKNQIFVDPRHNCVLLPIGQKHVPFHVSVIKNVSKHDEGNLSSLRFNFHVPGTASNLSGITFPEGEFLFLRELTFRSTAGTKMTEVFKRVKDLQKRAKNELEFNKENLSEQESLNLIKGKFTKIN